MNTKIENGKEFLRTTIPMDWNVARLDDCLELLTDFEANGSFAGVKENVKIFDSIEYAWYVRATDLENKSKIEDVKYVDEKTYNFLKKTKLTGGEVLITKRGEIGKVYLFEKKTAYATVAPNLYLLKLNPSVLPYFIYSFFKAEIGNRELRKIDSSSTLGALYKDDVKALKIPLPPLPEQKAIARVLSTADAAILTTEKLITQKELRKKWLMQQLLTGKKRLKGFSGEWKEMHIRDVAKEVSIRNKSDKQLTVLSCTKYDGLVPSLEYFGRKIFADDVSTYKIVPKDHFAYATNHIEEGSIGYQGLLDEALISPMYTVFKTNGTVNDIFFFRLLKSHPLVYQYQNRMEGSIDRRGGLRWDAFSIIKIKLPSIEEQTAIAHVLEVADKEISLLKAKAEKLREQKKGLMQVLLTGKVRLKII
jgi:type I restriction enzyme S subunit